MIEVKGKDNLLLCSGYRPPNTNLTEFQEAYNQLLMNMGNIKNTESLIGIDHNLDFIKQDIHPPTARYIEINLEHNMLPTITRPTRISNTCATLIDNILISSKLQGTFKSGVLTNDISDHMPCYLVLPDATTHKPIMHTVHYRNLNAKAKNNILDSLSQVEWQTELDDRSVEQAFNTFHHKIIDSIDKYAPIRTKTIKPSKQARAPWISTGILNSINRSKILYKKSIKTTAGFEQKDKYKKYQKALERIKRQAKFLYFSTKCIELRTNGSKLWKLINKITNKVNDKQSVINKINMDGIIVEQSKEIANSLANHFANIGKTLSDKLPQPKNSINSYINKIPTCPSSMYLNPTCSLEIDDIIRNMQNKKSSGYDNISNQMLKWLRPVITRPLSLIFNMSLEQGIFPNNMKIAEIVPLHKGGDESQCNNYRPISLLITISKILEKLMYSRTYKFLELNNILFQSQYGFRTQHSCTDAISELTGEITKNKENGIYTIGVFLDLSKAFDTLPHAILLNKMNKYGIRGIANKWFASYLETRVLRVKCSVASSKKKTISDDKPIEIGTPQGSCLGPLLFLLYNNDLYLNLEHTKVILFADDTTIYMGHRNLNYLRWCIETDLSIIGDWFRANKLTLNVGKSCCILLKKNNKNEVLNLTFQTMKVPQCTRVKFLGVWLDENLNWSYHCNTVINKIKRNSHLLRNSQRFLSGQALKLIYFAQVQSHVQYGLLVWGNQCKESHKTSIQKQLTKCWRLIAKGKSYDKDDKTSFLTLKKLIKLENYKLGYKIERGLVPVTISRLVSCDRNNKSLKKSHRYHTRTKNILNIPRHNTGSYHNSFLISVIRDYSNLPYHITVKKSLQTFVHHCKKHLSS